MEYMELGDLQQLLKQEKTLLESDAQQITFQTCEGLRQMHENGFIHRDLKPGVSIRVIRSYHGHKEKLIYLEYHDTE